MCAQRQIPYVFTSSDLVFDGREAPYRETDPIAPVNVYDRQKALEEQANLSAYPEALICRLPVMFGWSRSRNKAFDHRIMLAFVS